MDRPLPSGQAQRLLTKQLQDPYFLNKVIVITGASSGIGRTLAYWYLNNGAKVVLCGQIQEELDKIAK
jgi:NADP-dependent 3-hydroxy acid dehydrogenase YdfG